MAYPPDRASAAMLVIRALCRDIPDEAARQIEDWLRDDYAALVREVAAERPVED